MQVDGPVHFAETVEGRHVGYLLTEVEQNSISNFFNGLSVLETCIQCVYVCSYRQTGTYCLLQPIKPITHFACLDVICSAWHQLTMNDKQCPQLFSVSQRKFRNNS